MKRSALLSIIIISVLSLGASVQTSETFDIATFQAPRNWNKKTSVDSVQMSTEDKANGTYCLITLLRSLPGVGTSRQNFDAAWQTVVKEAVNVAAAPQMAPTGSSPEWKTEMGFAPFEKDGEKGMAVLATISGYGKMVNVFVLTNTPAHEPAITAFLESISLKKPVAENIVTPKTGPAAASPAAVASGYAFTTTNFDDGWTSTVQEDWVHVSKGNIRILIHHTNKQADAYNSVVMNGLKNAWDVLVAPRYRSARDLEFKPLTGWQAIEFAEGELVEAGTGRTVHVVLFKMNYSNGSGRYLEFITANKAAFEQEFGPYHETTYGWEKMEKMATYNKFAISAADLKGKWTNDFSGSLSYVNAYTGASAGTSSHASIENFAFGPGGTYKWDLGVASGQVGSIKFQSVKAAGRVSVPNTWQITFSDIEGRPRTYSASFSAVKGGRILWLDGKAYGKLD